MIASRGWRSATIGALVAFVAGVGMLALAAAATGPSAAADAAFAVLVCLPAAVLGLVVLNRRPTSPAGPGLLLLAASPCFVLGVTAWGATASSPSPLPLADTLQVVSAGIWVVNLTGFVVLCLTFPDAARLGRPERAALAGFVAVCLGVIGVRAWEVARIDVSGAKPPWLPVASAVLVAGLLGVLAASVLSLRRRYLTGGEKRRLQMRWLFLGALTVPALLVVGWISQLLGAPVWAAYLGFMMAMLVALPATIAVAILRHDLLDIDRLLHESVSWMLTTVVSAAVFAALVLVVATVGQGATGGAAPVTAAAFGTALLLLPLQHRIHAMAGRVLDRDRTVAVAQTNAFARRVQQGDSQPEEVEAVLRIASGDDGLTVLLARPDGSGYVGVDGEPAEPPAGSTLVPLRSLAADIGAIAVTQPTARRLRLVRELAVEARLPLEVSRLRLGLREALEDARSSRGRLVEAAAEERRRLEHDLHDGAQQRIVAVALRLRLLQRRRAPDDPVAQELQAAVAALEETVAELRRLAHGLRPGGLDDGLASAIRALVVHSPIPVTVDVEDVEVGEAVAATAYYVVSEGLSNALKHANARCASVTVRRGDDGLEVEVRDDGCGGARPSDGLTALQDRVAALGGALEVHSPPGAGTTMRAVI